MHGRGQVGFLQDGFQWVADQQVEHGEQAQDEKLLLRALQQALARQALQIKGARKRMFDEYPLAVAALLNVKEQQRVKED